MSKFTETLGLPITTNVNMNFGEWWRLINGDGTSDGGKSAFQIIDDYFKDFKPTSNVTIKESASPTWESSFVPNTGYVGTIYINRSMSKEDVISLLETLDYKSPFDNEHYSYYVAYFYQNIDSYKEIYISKHITSTKTEYSINYRVNKETLKIFDSTSGWLESEGNTIISEVDFNSENFNIIPTVNGTEFYGEGNNKLATLFSITPFEQIGVYVKGGIYIDDEISVAANVEYTQEAKQLSNILIGNEVFYIPSLEDYQTTAKSVNLNIGNNTTGSISTDNIERLKTDYKNNYIFADNKTRYNFLEYDKSNNVIKYSAIKIIDGFTYTSIILVDISANTWTLFNTKIQADVNVNLGGLVVYKQGGGTPVPNSGICPDIYLNTNLSIDEVKALLDTITYHDMGKSLAYFAFLSKYIIGNTNYMVQLTIVKVNNDYGVALVINDGEEDSTEILFSTNVDMGGFEGWNTTFGNIINIEQFNSTLNNVYEEIGLSVGDQNDKLSSLFSITPFTSGGLFETNEDGTPNTDKPIQTGISEERVNELIDLKITGWLGGES